MNLTCGRSSCVRPAALVLPDGRPLCKKHADRLPAYLHRKAHPTKGHHHDPRRPPPDPRLAGVPSEPACPASACPASVTAP